MLLNLHKKTWMDGLMLQDYNEHCSLNEQKVKVGLILLIHYKYHNTSYWCDISRKSLQFVVNHRSTV